MIDYHRLMLGDTVRTQCFEKALRSVIKTGKTNMVDIGSGTGFLSFIARALGVKSSVLYEQSPDLSALSKVLAQQNHIGELQFKNMHSTQESKPKQVELVVSETLGNYALEENILETMADAMRFLAPGGTMMPSRIKQYCAPVITDRVFRELNVWGTQPYGLEFSKAAEIAWNNIYVRRILPRDLWTGEAPRCWDTVILGKDTKSQRQAILEWKITAPTTWYGMALWWIADLAPGVPMSTAPEAPLTHWEQIYVPVGEPLQLYPGFSVEFGIESDTRYEVKIRLQWSVIVRDAHGKVSQKRKFDMWKGHLE
jgi:Ribosomal protein L11 methyltransferase (PrmA)